MVATLIALIGLPGSGKSTVGRQLARRLQLPFLDSDHVIEERLGCSIKAAFERDGEESFRNLEEAVLDELTQIPRAVVSTGGGAILRPATRQRLRERGHVVYLKSSPEEIFRRLKHDASRPLLQVEDPLARLRDLFAARDTLYRETAHFSIETGRPSVHTLVNMIVMQLELAGAHPLNCRAMQAQPAATTPPSSAKHVHIDLGDRSYPILIAPALLDDPATFASLPAGNAALVVTNTTVGPLYAARLQTALQKRYKSVQVLALPDGEAYKTWQTLNTIFDALLSEACDRKTVLFALGGGVVGDMTGFAAASYMRGVPFVQVPTTLLAQVDSSVGGKTGINHPLGKNMVGAFYQPLQVVCDLDTLKTLPARELSAGLAEVIKYGPIADLAFLDWIEGNMDALLARDVGALAHAVQRSCEIKAWVVGQDERESGLRAILNFGHTFGHAIEAGMGYGTWLHGEAVGCGMVMAAELSLALGLVDAAFVTRLRALVRRAGLPVTGPRLDAADNAGRYLDLMRVDKKAEGGEIRFVLIDGPSHACLRTVPDALVRQVVDACCV